MQIQVPVTHFETVNLSTDQCRDIAARVLAKVADVPTDAYLKGAWLCTNEEECFGGHSHVSMRQLRKATPLDIQVVEMLKLIRKTKFEI